MNVISREYYNEMKELKSFSNVYQYVKISMYKLVLFIII